MLEPLKRMLNRVIPANYPDVEEVRVQEIDKRFEEIVIPNKSKRLPSGKFVPLTKKVPSKNPEHFLKVTYLSPNYIPQQNVCKDVNELVKQFEQTIGQTVVTGTHVFCTWKKSGMDWDFDDED